MGPSLTEPMMPASSHASCKAISSADLPFSRQPLGTTQRLPLRELTRHTRPFQTTSAAACSTFFRFFALAGPSLFTTTSLLFGIPSPSHATHLPGLAFTNSSRVHHIFVAAVNLAA